jgi:hypothetical protein
MPDGFGRGGSYGRGGGNGRGFGFRGNSPPWPYVGRGRGGLPRCGYFSGSAGIPAPWSYNPAYYPAVADAQGYPPNAPRMSREEELNYMKSQAEAVKGELEEINSRIHDLEKEK